MSGEAGSSAERAFPVRSRAGSYSVVVARGGAATLVERIREVAGARACAVVSDDTVADLYGRDIARRLQDTGCPTTLLRFPPGEGSKTRKEWARLSDELLEAGLGRDGAVVAVGGGVTGDLAGFVAATYMRGVPLIQVPTTLLAMVDASIGGKTGVDTRHGKNLIGAFHPPRIVLTDPELACTQSRNGRAQGLAEALKHGAVLDAGYLNETEAALDACLDGDADALLSVVSGSVAIKTRIVSEDEQEGGLRSLLNFGHTLGHAIEVASDYSVSHGHAVALGMVLEARLGESLGATAAGTSDRLAVAAARLGVPAFLPRSLDPERVLAATRNDKKARGGRTRYVLLEEPGRALPGEGWVHPVEWEDVRRALVRGPA